MQQLVCDGCQRTEEANQPDRRHQVRHVEIAMQEDKRDYPENKELFTADLCPKCREFILKTFFRQHGEGEEVVAFDHELPEFMSRPPIETESLRAVT